jgi:serine/threonine protein kinase
MIHDDVKPSNILLHADFKAKIGDFGWVRLKTEDLVEKREAARMMLRSCYRPLKLCFVGRLGYGCGGGGDGLLWHTDLKLQSFGDYSIAVVQVNSNLEDQNPNIPLYMSLFISSNKKNEEKIFVYGRLCFDKAPFGWYRRERVYICFFFSLKFIVVVMTHLQ